MSGGAAASDSPPTVTVSLAGTSLSKRLQDMVPFTVDPPEWYVFNSRFGGRGARAGAGTSWRIA
jgi:hypothetical protein